MSNKYEIKVGSPVMSDDGFGEVVGPAKSVTGDRNWWVLHNNGVKRWYAGKNLKLLVEVESKQDIENAFLRALRGPKEPTHYVNIDGSVFVKEAGFFIGQGGLKEKWGEGWIPVCAENVHHARELGRSIKSKKEDMEKTLHEENEKLKKIQEEKEERMLKGAKIAQEIIDSRIKEIFGDNNVPRSLAEKVVNVIPPKKPIKSHRKIYDECYKKCFAFLNIDCEFSEDFSSRRANIYAVKNTNKEYLNQFEGCSDEQ